MVSSLLPPKGAGIDQRSDDRAGLDILDVFGRARQDRITGRGRRVGRRAADLEIGNRIISRQTRAELEGSGQRIADQLNDGSLRCLRER